MKSFGTFLVVISLVAFIACGIFAAQSYDKYTNYYNSDYSRLNKNAYVGGDAYNYIINGTYFTAFAIYSVGCGIAGIVLFSLGGLMIGLDNRYYNYCDMQVKLVSDSSNLQIQLLREIKDEIKTNNGLLPQGKNEMTDDEIQNV